MSSLSPKDRVSLCSFTFSDGRRCRSPRTGKRSRFCFDHAQKDARARAAESLSRDLSYFFSGTYLSACDLSTAMGRLIPAVIRGDVKPKVARTVAYMAQTLLQSIRMSQHEYINAFSTDGWRQSIRNSVNGNHNYRFPPAPEPDSAPEPEQPAPTVGAMNVAAGLQPGSLTAAPPSNPPQPAQPQTQPQHQPPAPQPTETPVNCHSERSEESAFSESQPGHSSLATPLPRPGRGHSPLPQSPRSEIPTLSGPAPSPHTPLPPTSAEFAQHLLAGLPTGSLPATPHLEPAPPNPNPAETPQAPTAQTNNPPPTRPSTPPNATPSSPSTPPTPTSATSPAPPQPQAQPPAAPPTQTPEAPTPQPACPEQNRKANPREPNRDAPWLHWSTTSNIPPDSKLL